ncbi:hypothetical protein OV079_51780 [Nannocystis pusilla]|uniref:AMP-binding enzyme C-terminal domain-containing protein n=1 Tax=Nannocystis pusilla TaxID=889268 RepID=A0A9X3J2J3_9BACT|nr:hypothetical protein [Nannocystis pusilla]MCY1013872.1 hypothetical protein [Nannocystis pusilla]
MRPADFRPDALLERLRDKLPGCPIPSRFVLLDALPQGPGGEVDRDALVDGQPQSGVFSSAPLIAATYDPLTAQRRRSGPRPSGSRWCCRTTISSTSAATPRGPPTWCCESPTPTACSSPSTRSTRPAPCAPARWWSSGRSSAKRR